MRVILLTMDRWGSHTAERNHFVVFDATGVGTQA